MTSKNIYIDNHRLHYAVDGIGTPVVLIHGFGEDSQVWKYQCSQLAKHCRLLIPDLPGSGQSDLIQEMSMESMAAIIKKMLEHESIQTGAIVIGHSMGGYIALAFAEKYADVLAGFGLFHSTAFADSAEKKASRQKAIAFIQTHGSSEFIKQSTPNLFTEDYRIKNSAAVAEMITRYSNFDPLALVAYYEAMIMRPDRTAVLQSFTKPVLFIIGKQDRAVPFEDSLRQCHLPELADIQIMENAAHMGMWEEKDKSTKVLLSFVQEVAV